MEVFYYCYFHYHHHNFFSLSSQSLFTLAPSPTLHRVNYSFVVIKTNIIKGDFVALQVGDRVPADCALIIDNNICSLAPLTRAGSKIMMHQEIGFENNQINSCSPDFPPGQSSFSENSTKLLKLSRDIRVFVLQESPIEKFLQKEEGASQSMDYNILI